MRSDALAARGFFIEDGFLSDSEVRSLLDCAARRRERGGFVAAAIGAGSDLRVMPAVRGDATCWLDQPLLEAERLLLGRLEELRLELNESLYLGLFDLELHYACYPPGARYARHVDQPQGRTQRRVSVIMYLNPGWGEADGGALRLHEGDGGWQDVLPVGGRLVCFKTERREHEVLGAGRERLSLSGWFRTREA